MYAVINPVNSWKFPFSVRCQKGRIVILGDVTDMHPFLFKWDFSFQFSSDCIFINLLMAHHIFFHKAMLSCTISLQQDTCCKAATEMSRNLCLVSVFRGWMEGSTCQEPARCYAPAFPCALWGYLPFSILSHLLFHSYLSAAVNKYFSLFIDIYQDAAYYGSTMNVFTVALMHMCPFPLTIIGPSSLHQGKANQIHLKLKTHQHHECYKPF